MTPPSPRGHSPAAYGDPNARAATRREIVRFMLLAFGLTWGAGGLALIIGRLNAGAGLTSGHPLYFLAAYGPSVAALIMTARLDGRRGLRDLLARLVPRAANVPWYVTVLARLPSPHDRRRRARPIPDSSPPCRRGNVCSC